MKAAADKYIKQDGGLILNLAIHRHCSDIGDGVYSEICGGFIEGVYQWATHNIVDIIETSNEKYTGWTVHFTNGNTRQFYMKNGVLDYIADKCKGWRHAKNTFNNHFTRSYKNEKSK
jgi:hypothetical protein